jgi:two-component system, OmpR family, osmolarity sensor histidine kinase EnvZ
MNPLNLLKRILPHSLLGRSILIIVMPLILLQMVSTWIFYDRHWSTITRRLATAVAADILMSIETMRQFPGEANQRWVLDKGKQLGMRMTFEPGAILPNDPPRIGRGILDRRLARALDQQLRRPFQMDTRNYRPEVRIRVQLAGGVLDILVTGKRLFSSTTYIFVMWMVGTSMLLFAVASIFMRNQVRPIQRLANAVDSFGKGRDVPVFKPEGATEIRLAAAAFERMRERISSAITQRTEMLAGVSHDLRTPLTRMKLQLAMLGDGAEVAELQSDVAEMERLVDEYLAFARGESTEAVIETDIGRLLEEVVDGARRAGGSVALGPVDELVVPLRPHAFKRAVGNVVANAMHHAGHASVTAACRGDAIEITIDDDGPGIPAAARDQVFAPFYRLDNSRNPATGGSGLGLTIARDVIRGHGGDIILEDAPAGGVRARLRLPL